jgi:polyhydroxybutyrate depolymerase
VRLVPVVCALLLGGGAFALTYRLLGEPSPPPLPRDAVERGVPLTALPDAARQLQIGGRDRTFQLYRPLQAPPVAPLWIVLHGSGGSGDDMRRMHDGAFDRLAERKGLVVAYPDGYDEHWNDCRPRADYAANTLDVDDVGFLRELVDTLYVEEGIDLERVTILGISNGGQMVFRLAFEAPELAQSYVALLANLPAPGNDDCHHSGVPVKMLLINGSEDPINPAQGGVVSLAGNTSRGAVLSAQQTASAFARIAGHEGPPTARRYPDRALADGTSIETSSWSGEGRPRVAWIRVVGGGHSVPTTASLPAWPPAMRTYLLEVYGRQSSEFETAEAVWRFSSSTGAELL